MTEQNITILPNPFYTDSANKAYEQALSDMLNWLIQHNKRFEVKEFLLAYPFVLAEDDYWLLRQRIEKPEPKAKVA